MKKGQIWEGIVKEVDFPNKGIVEVTETLENGEVREHRVIVKNAIKGQTVRFGINKARKGKYEGRLLEVLKPSELETRTGACAGFGQCGGCSYQALSYEEQLNMKALQVEKLLRAVCPDLPFEGIVGSPNEWEYRNKMEFTFGDEYKDGPLALGMHKKGSFHDIVTTKDCKIVHKDYGIILDTVLQYFTERNISFHHRMTHEGYLRHLLVRRAVKTGELLISVVTTTQEMVPLQPLVEALLSLPLEGKIVGILHVKNDSLADVVQSDETEVLYGQDYFYEELLGLKFKISTFSFFQTNSLGAEVLYTTAREFMNSDGTDAAKGKVVFDLYSGTGTIAQMMAPAAKKVIGVEIIEEAVVAARENAKLNGLDNCEFIAGDVLKMLDTIEERPDFLVLDPPRDGIHPKALKKIIDYGVDQIVYISCKPTSLARDLETFQECGYEVKRVKCVDMFPQTVHVETVCLLSKLHEAKHHINVKVDMDELDLTSAEAKATYKEIEEWVQEHYGFHVTNLNIAQVKQKHGIIERENYNKPKSENSRQPGCPEEKVKAIEEALKFFQMI